MDEERDVMKAQHARQRRRLPQITPQGRVTRTGPTCAARGDKHFKCSSCHSFSLVNGQRLLSAVCCQAHLSLKKAARLSWFNGKQDMLLPFCIPSDPACPHCERFIPSLLSFLDPLCFFSAERCCSVRAAR